MLNANYSQEDEHGGASMRVTGGGWSSSGPCASELQRVATAARLLPECVPRLHGRESPLLRRSSPTAWLLQLAAAPAPARPRAGLHLLPRPAATRPVRAASLAAGPAHRPPYVAARVAGCAHATCPPARRHGRPARARARAAPVPCWLQAGRRERSREALAG